MKIKIGYDVIDNACHKLLEEIAGKDLKWNVEAFGAVRDEVENVLWKFHGIKLVLVDDSICAKAEEGQIPIIVIVENEKGKEDIGADI